MDPLALTGLTLGLTGAVLAGTGHAYLLRPPTPSPEVVRGAARVTATGTLMASIALTGATTAAADDTTPWGTSRPTATMPAEIPASVPSAPVGPDNPQAQPDGSLSTEPIPDVQPWGTARHESTKMPATPPAPASASAPRRPRATARPSGPRRPSSRAVLPRRTARTARIVVQPGQTLGELARTHGTTVRALVAANRGRYPTITANYVQAGWRLGGVR